MIIQVSHAKLPARFVEKPGTSFFSCIFSVILLPQHRVKAAAAARYEVYTPIGSLERWPLASMLQILLRSLLTVSESSSYQEDL